MGAGFEKVIKVATGPLKMRPLKTGDVFGLSDGKEKLVAIMLSTIMTIQERANLTE